MEPGYEGNINNSIDGGGTAAQAACANAELQTPVVEEQQQFAAHLQLTAAAAARGGGGMAAARQLQQSVLQPPLRASGGGATPARVFDGAQEAFEGGSAGEVSSDSGGGWTTSGPKRCSVNVKSCIFTPS